jgi:hypothetical protein
MTFKHNVPDTKQIRTRSEFCTTYPSFIPDTLRNDGLSEDIFMSIVDWYIGNRIEPEQLMFANFEADWNAARHPMFTQYAMGVRFLNETDVDPEGEWTTVYNIYASDEENENNTPLSQFLNKWWLNIKEKCSVEDNNFWFVLEFSRHEADLSKIYMVELFEGDWYEYEDTNVSLSTLTDFTLRHRGV